MIPKILHFCFGMTRKGTPWSLHHHACIKSAVERIKPAKTIFYCEFEPQGSWWRLTREMVTIVNIKAPRTIFGNPLVHPAHRSDVVRLEKLLEFGGIYLDCDVFVHRDFDDLLPYSTVLGQECGRGLCNAVILAEVEAPFLKRWYDEYRSFRSKGRDGFWNEHSGKIPSRLAREFPEEITVLPDMAFFWPTWQNEGLKRIFASVDPIFAPGVYANHLWESCAWEPYLEHLTPKRVRYFDSNFHNWVKPMIAELPGGYGAPTRISRMNTNLRRATRRIRSRLKLRTHIKGILQLFSGLLQPAAR